MLVGLLLCVIGVVSLVVSASLTSRYLAEAGLGAEDFRSAAGKQIVPSWVSLINLGGWAGVLCGIVVILNGLL